MDLMFNTVFNSDSIQGFDMGIGVGDDEAVAASVLPDPNIAGDRPMLDWVWRDSVTLYSNEFTGGSGAGLTQRIHEEVRSKRKLGEGVMYLIVNNTLLAGSASSLRLAGLIRQLYLMP